MISKYFLSMFFEPAFDLSEPHDLTHLKNLSGVLSMKLKMQVGNLNVCMPACIKTASLLSFIASSFQ